eukprot:9485080-Pyramimonas_sp.AAC.1
MFGTRPDGPISHLSQLMMFGPPRAQAVQSAPHLARNDDAGFKFTNLVICKRPAILTDKRED